VRHASHQHLSGPLATLHAVILRSAALGAPARLVSLLQHWLHACAGGYMRRAGVWRVVILTLNGEGPNSARSPPFWSAALAKPLAGSTSGIHSGSPRGLERGRQQKTWCIRMSRPPSLRDSCSVDPSRPPRALDFSDEAASEARQRSEEYHIAPYFVSLSRYCTTNLALMFG
jgi:hypothetical protein